MRRSRGFSRAPLEVDDSDNLQMFALPPMGKIATLSLAAFIQIGAQGLNILDRIGTPAICRRLGLRPFAF